MPLDPQLEPLIDAAGRQHNVDPTLLKSLILTESDGNPRAVSPAGAQGIAQLMPGTAKELGVTDPFDVTQAIPAAARYLAQGLDKYNDPQKALMYYHGGPDEGIWGPKTQAYPNTVAQHYGRLTGSTEPASGTRQTKIEALANVAIPAPGTVVRDKGGSYREPSSYGSAKADELIRNPSPSSAIDALAQVGKPAAGMPVMQASSQKVAQAGGEAIPTDQELLDLLKTYKPASSAPATGAPASGAPATATGTATATSPLGSPPAAPSLTVPLADPKNAMYPATMIPQLMTFPAGVNIAQQLQKFTEQGYQLNKDGTLSPVKGGPHDPGLLQQSKTAEALGTARQTQGPGGVIAPLPGSNESDAARAKAVAAGTGEGGLPTAVAQSLAAKGQFWNPETKQVENMPNAPESGAATAAAETAGKDLLVKQPDGSYKSAEGVDPALAGRAKAVAAGEAEGKAPTEIAKGVAAGSTKEFFDRATAARDAVKSIENSQQAYDLLDKGIITGTGADFMLNVTKALHQAGLIDSDKIASTEAFVASRAQEVGRIIKQFGSGTGLSDADREYAAKIAGGTIKLDEKSIKEILNFNDRVTRTIIKEYNKDAEKITNPLGYPLTVVEPPPRADPLEGREAANLKTGEKMIRRGGKWEAVPK